VASFIFTIICWSSNLYPFWLLNTSLFWVSILSHPSQLVYSIDLLFYLFLGDFDFLVSIFIFDYDNSISFCFIFDYCFSNYYCSFSFCLFKSSIISTYYFSFYFVSSCFLGCYWSFFYWIGIVFNVYWLFWIGDEHLDLFLLLFPKIYYLLALLVYPLW